MPTATPIDPITTTTTTPVEELTTVEPEVGTPAPTPEEEEEEEYDEILDDPRPYLIDYIKKYVIT